MRKHDKTIGIPLVVSRPSLPHWKQQVNPEREEQTACYGTTSEQTQVNIPEALLLHSKFLAGDVNQLCQPAIFFRIGSEQKIH